MYKSVRGTKKFDKSADNAGLNDLFDGGVSLLGEEFSELGGRLDLLVDLVREDTLDHLGEFFVQLYDCTALVMYSAAL